MTRRISVHKERWPLKEPFHITGKSWDELDFIVVEISEDDAMSAEGKHPEFSF